MYSGKICVNLQRGVSDIGKPLGEMNIWEMYGNSPLFK